MINVLIILFAWFLSNLHRVTRLNFSFHSLNMERFSLKFVYNIHIRRIKWQEIEESGVIPSPSLIWFFPTNGPFDITFINLFKKILDTTKWKNCSQCLHRRENNVKLENDYVLVSTPSGIHSHKVPSIYYVSIWTGWVSSENNPFCLRLVLYLCRRV